jgi:hypothetical protein
MPHAPRAAAARALCVWCCVVPSIGEGDFGGSKCLKLCSRAGTLTTNAFCLCIHVILLLNIKPKLRQGLIGLLHAPHQLFITAARIAVQVHKALVEAPCRVLLVHNTHSATGACPLL